MSTGCDLLLVFNAREKIREKNSVINQLRNQVSLLEEKLREKCDEIAVLHEQLYALSHRVDCLSSRRTQKFTRFTSRDNQSTSFFDNGASSSLDNMNKLDLSESNYIKLSKQLECMQMLTAKSPLNINNSSTKSSKTIIYNSPSEYPIYDDQNPKINGNNYCDFSLNDIFNDDANYRHSDIIDNNEFITSPSSSDPRPRTYSEVPRKSKSPEDPYIPSIFISNQFDSTHKSPTGVSIASRPNHGHKKTNSLSLTTKIRITSQNSLINGNKSPPSYAITNRSIDFKDIINYASKKLVIHMNNSNKIRLQLDDTFSNIQLHKYPSLDEPMDGDSLLDKLDDTLIQKSLLFTKYSFQNELLHTNEEIIMYLKQIILKLQDYALK